MDDRLLPRKVPEPTRFPSAIFEPCVPDASLVFGCGLFEAPTASAKVTKPPHETVSTEDLLRRGTQETAIPSWIKAYGVEKKSVNTCNFEQSDLRCLSSEDSERRADFQVSERKSSENFSARIDSGLSGAGITHVGQKTGVDTREADKVRRENSPPETCDKLGKNGTNNFPKGTTADTRADRYRYGLEGNKVMCPLTCSEVSGDCSTERQGGVTPMSQHYLADVAGESGRPTRDLPDPTGVHYDGTMSAAVPAPRGQVEHVAERSSIPLGHADRQAGVSRHADASDRVTMREPRDIVSDMSAPRLPQAGAGEFRKKGDKFPEPQKGFISSDCSLSDCTPLDSGRRRGKWKNKLAKENDPASVLYETVGRPVRERDSRAVGTSKMRGSPARAKRRDTVRMPFADFGNVGTLEEVGGARASVSDPLIRALFHLQNRHTELLLQLAADVGEVALKQKRMFDVFQRLQSAFCDSGVRTSTEAAPSSGRDRRRRCDKCTQTDSDDGSGERMPHSAVDASTQSDRAGGAEGGRMSDPGRPGGDETVSESGVSRKMPEDFGVAVRAADEEVGRLAESGSCVAERSERRGVEARADPGTGGGGDEAPGRAVSPADVRRLIGAVRSIAARVEDSGGKKRQPSREAGTGTRGADEGRGEAEADVAGLIAAMRSAASRYKNNDFIKAPSLEDVAEATENSSDSEDDASSEAGDESLTLGDLSLSLVPQNVSLSPDPSLRIDPRGLEVSSDALQSGSDGSDSERSAHYSKEKEDCSDNTDTTAIFLYRNIFSKVQEILEHSKTAPESRRESSGKKPSTPEAENGRTRTRSH